jgi:hypothetical protein
MDSRMNSGPSFRSAPGVGAGMLADPDSRHPGFHPYRRLRNELLGLPAEAWVARCNLLAGSRDLRSAAGASLSFVVDDASMAGALGYEAAILHQGRIACRAHGRGALHDLHNALAWLTFPRIKAALNRLHLERAGGPGKGRGRVRDAVTLLDESGLLWLSRSTLLDEQLLARDWRGLLVANRERVRAEVLPIIVGHGLLEKLATPYKSMTAHCLVCSGCPVPATERDLAERDLAGIDATVAAAIAAAFTAHGLPKLAPLPILGLPGWDPANTDRSYYDDARVFRA